MKVNNKIEKLAKRIIEIATINGRLDDNRLLEGILNLKKRGFKNFIPLVRALKPKISKALSWQVIEITSPTSLSQENLDLIKTSISKKYKKEVDHKTFIDPSLVSGFKVQIGDDLYDASLTAQLSQITNEI